MTRYHCTRCGRRLKAATPSGMGDKCERAAFGTRQRKEKRERVQRDSLTVDMFRGVAA